jgi:uncharacterized SAM-binding protein YcdF (DUF218 family)
LSSADRARPTSRLRLAGWFVLAALLIYTAVLAAVIVASREDQRRTVAAIAVLGAAQYNGKPSPVLRARLDHALSLYHDRLAPVIVVLGGQAEGDRESEAGVGARYLTDHGVPAAVVVALAQGRTTAGSLAALGDWGRVHNATTVLLVSDPFHALRLRIEARRAGLEGFSSPTRTSPISARRTRELPYFLAEALKVPLVWLRSLFW